MSATRRELLAGFSGLALASVSLASVSACSTTQAAKSIGRIALLSPLSGDKARLGQAVERAARMAATPSVVWRSFDTSESAGGVHAAMRGVGVFKPGMIVGPVSAIEARAVEAAVPVITLSNDETLGEEGLFVMGVTAVQSTAAILAYARQSGIRSVAIVNNGSDWSGRCAAAAVETAGSNGLRMFHADALPSDSPVEALRSLSEGQLPHAVLLPEGGASAVKSGKQLRAAGVQVLGTSQWTTADMLDPALEGAWIAAPDPKAAARFVNAYSDGGEETPGLIAGLAYDAMSAAMALGRTQRMSRAGLMRAEGFSGVTGMFRFTTRGKPERRLSILVASADGVRAVAGEAMPWM